MTIAHVYRWNDAQVSRFRHVLTDLFSISASLLLLLLLLSLFQSKIVNESCTRVTSRGYYYKCTHHSAGNRSTASTMKMAYSAPSCRQYVRTIAVDDIQFERLSKRCRHTVEQQQEASPKTTRHDVMMTLTNIHACLSVCLIVCQSIYSVAESSTGTQ